MVQYETPMTIEIEMTAAVALRLAEAAGREAQAMRAESQVQHAEGVMSRGQSTWTEIQTRMLSDRLWDEAAELMNAGRAIGKAALIAAGASAFHAPASLDIDVCGAIERAWDPMRDPAPDLQRMFDRLHEIAEEQARIEPDLPEDPFAS